MFPAVGVIENGCLTPTCGSQPDLTSSSGKAKQQDRNFQAFCVCVVVVGGGHGNECCVEISLNCLNECDKVSDCDTCDPECCTTE